MTLTYRFIAIACLLALIISCGSTDPQYPAPPYFGDPPVYVDGDFSLGELFLDFNANGVWDSISHDPEYPSGEPFTDKSGDGHCNAADEPWENGVPFIDLNLNGVYDFPNGEFDRRSSSGRDEPWVHAIVSEGDVVCVPVSFAVSVGALTIETLPPATFNKMASTLCWEPRSSGAQILTIIATNGGGEKDTLSVTTYVSMRPMVESITPAEVVRGQAVELTMSVRHDVYETLQPTYPPNLVTPGTQMYRSLPQGIFRYSFTVSPSAGTGQYNIGVKVPGIMNGSNTVPITVIE